MPVKVPTTIEHQGLKCCQGIAGVLAPVHALVLLPPSYNQVVGLLRVGAADVTACPATLLVSGNARLPLLQVGDELIQGVFVFGLRSIRFQESHRPRPVAWPQMTIKRGQELHLGLAPATD